MINEGGDRPGGPLNMLWVKLRVADGKFTSELAFRTDYLCWTAHLLKYSCAGSSLGLAYSCTIR